MKRSGQGLVEYVLLLALIGMVTAGALSLTGESTRDIFGRISGGDSGAGGETPVATPLPTNIRVQVMTDTGTPLDGIVVEAFDENESIAGSAETDATGLATVSDLDDGRYIFRATYAGQGYWSETITVPAQTQVAISIAKRKFNVHVISSQGATLRDVPVYAFNASGGYIGQKATTDQNGMVTFELPDGSYKFRADYRAQATWSDVVTTPALSSVHIRVPISKFTVRVYDRKGKSMQNVSVYAFNESGGYAGIKARTDQNGMATMELPDGKYKFRADYGGDAYWSDIVSAPNVNSTSVYVGGYEVTVRVTDTNGNVIPNRMVYVYSSEGDYLKRGRSTDQNGNVIFELNNGSYKFRVTDEDGQEFWSDTIAVPDVVNTTIRIERGSFVVTVTDRNNIASQKIAVYVYRYQRYGHYTSYQYTGQAKYADINGQASFDLSNGEYIFLAYNFSRGRYEWSNKVKVPARNAVTVRIR